MSETGQITNRDLDGRLDRIEDKLDTRMTVLDSKVDLVASRMDKLEGALGMLKWLGPTGVAAVGYALLKGAGYL